MKIARLPQNDNTNGWSACLPARTPHAPLKSDARADWLVIGGGFAGLAAARRLAQNNPNDKIALLEAHRCGENASGRNSGFAIDLPHLVSSSLDELHASHAYLRLARAAIAYLEKQVKDHNIDCDWSRDGKYQTAVTDRGTEAMLKPFADALDMLEEPYEWIDASTLKKKLGTAHFAHAVYTPGCVLMNPAALVRGLADSLPENVTIYENSPVLEIDYSNGTTVKTPEGELRAPKTILATNGFTEQFGFLEKQLFHLAAHASLTRPMTPDEQAAFGVEKPWGVTPANAFGSITMRYTKDHRLLIRHDIHAAPRQATSPEALKKKSDVHRALLHDRFPSVPDLDIESSWTGYVAMTRNGAPAFGQLASGVWVSACQNAIGVNKGTVSGMLCADLASGRDNPLIADMQALGTPAHMPPRTLMNLGVRARIGWEKFKNRHEV